MALLDPEPEVVADHLHVAAELERVARLAAEHLGQPGGQVLDVTGTRLGAEDLLQNGIFEAAGVLDLGEPAERLRPSGELRDRRHDVNLLNGATKAPVNAAIIAAPTNPTVGSMW